MFKKITNKLQTREGLMFLGSIALIFAMFALLAFGVKAFSSGDRDSSATPATIQVSGTGEVEASPDVATFTFSISKDAATVASARDAASTIGNAILAKLKAAGIADKDISTTGFTADPKYQNQATSAIACLPGVPCPPTYNQVIVGYTVTNSYSVKVRDLDNVSSIATILTDASISSLDGPNFSIDDPTSIQNQARAKAIDDAKSQAEVLARQLGVHLGKITDFQDTGSGGIVPMAYNAMAASAPMTKSVSPDLPTGQTSVTSNVTITYQIR